MKPNDQDLFTSILEEFKRNAAPTPDSDPFKENFLTDELDHEILKHRDAHFAGDFKVMHRYYQTENNRGHPDIDLERIEYLAQVEASLNQNLSETLLTEQEKGEVLAARKAYETLKEFYSQEDNIDLTSRLLADLILVEDEEAEEELSQIVAKGDLMVQPLIKVIESPEAYNPLFPGYGYAPYLAAIALGRIKSPAAIIPLFEQLNKEALFDEEVSVEALREIGEPAKKYLLETIASRPITKENIHAAYALSAFNNDLEIAEKAFSQLKDPEVLKNTLFTSYLLCNIDALQNSPLKDEVLAWAKSASLSATLREEVEDILSHWK